MKYTVKFTSRFKRDYKLAQKRGLDTAKLMAVVNMIADGDKQDQLTAEYNDHALTGNWKGYRECHVHPDWLLIYELLEDVLVLSLARTGTHSDLFNK